MTSQKGKETQVVQKLQKKTQVNIHHLYTISAGPFAFLLNPKYFWPCENKDARIWVSIPQIHMSFQVVLWYQLEAVLLEFQGKKWKKRHLCAFQKLIGSQSSHMVRTCLLKGMKIESMLMSSSFV